MKPNLTIFALIFAALSFTACVQGQNEIEIQPRAEDDWRNVKNIMVPEFAEALAANGLVLKGCEYLGEINSEAELDELISYFVADDTYWAADVLIRDSLYFTIRQMRDLPKVGEDWREATHLALKERLSNLTYPVIGKAELFWNYKGLDFSTLCAVSRKEDGKLDVVWNTITSHLLIPSGRRYRESTEEAVLSESLRTRGDDYLTKEVELDEDFKNDKGVLGARVGYHIFAWGGKGRSGEIEIMGATHDYWSSASLPGWTADCKVMEGFSSSPERQVEFYYGWG